MIKLHSIQPLYWLLPAALVACSADAPEPYEILAKPPQIVVIPTENASSTEDKIRTKGLGDKVTLNTAVSPPVIEVNESKETTWDLVEHALRHQRISMSDRNRDKGYVLVNYTVDVDAETIRNTDGVAEEEGLLSGFFNSKNESLHKFQLNIKPVEGKSITRISTKDLGAITRLAKPKEDITEVVDPKADSPKNSEEQLLSTLYKLLRDGYDESSSLRERLRD